MTLNAAVISLGSKSSKWTAKAMKNYFRTADMLDIREIEVNLGHKEVQVLYQGKPIEKYDCILAKGSFRYAPLLRSITSILSKHTYMPIEADAFTVAHDKLITQLILQQNGIPMPITYLAATPDAAKKVLKKINYPIIMKFPQGTQGKGVMFADSYASASSMLDALTALRQPFLIQEYIETGGADLRVIVVGNKVVAAMQREASGREKRANIHAGGTGKSVKVDPVTSKIAVKTAKLIGADVCAVDILEGHKGPMVIEVNISPGLQGITKTSGINVADHIAKFLHKRTKEISEEKKKIEAKEIMKDITPEGPGKEIITGLDFRGERVLLPSALVKETGFNEKDEVSIKVDKGKLVIEKFDVKKEEKKEKKK
ncbi:RimK family alpha-L-glutamate ligase [Candidatus Woesearchaeota archaeon]|nr:RimK family alpha-L-glutamate ligase [Candidatus Woesearchaeota archaeon]